jgi:hypothetical protein
MTPKSPSCFYPSPRHKDGLNPWCSECRSTYQREWWASNQHKHREYDAGCRKDWREANPERVKAIVARQNANKRGRLKDDYVVGLLRKRGVGEPTTEMVNACREIIRVKRLVKELEGK